MTTCSVDGILLLFHDQEAIMQSLGTILPNSASLQSSENYARQLQRDQAKVAKRLKNFRRESRFGEIRYYDGTQFYAVVGRDLIIKWFEVRKDGDYAIKRK